MTWEKELNEIGFLRVSGTTEGLVFRPEIPATSQALHVPYQAYYERPEAALARAEYARPRVFGYLENIPDGPDITSPGVCVKKSSSAQIGVPACFDFSVPLLQFAAQDLLTTHSPQQFREAEIGLIVQRTNVPLGEAGRATFGHWHTHTDHEIDVVYTYSDRLPTHFRNGAHISSSGNNSVVRFGAEIEHCSQQNNEETLRRTWIAVVVRNTARALRNSKNEAFNIAIAKPTEAFEAAAAHYLGFGPARLTPANPSFVLENF
jgi:hypothetical protein